LNSRNNKGAAHRNICSFCKYFDALLPKGMIDGFVFQIRFYKYSGALHLLMLFFKFISTIKLTIFKSKVSLVIADRQHPIALNCYYHIGV